jgi:hypothetical protein
MLFRHVREGRWVENRGGVVVGGRGEVLPIRSEETLPYIEDRKGYWSICRGVSCQELAEQLKLCEQRLIKTDIFQ